MSIGASLQNLSDWLQSEQPDSRRQARLGQAWRTWLLFTPTGSA
jgi:hypothetical protein